MSLQYAQGLVNLYKQLTQTLCDCINVGLRLEHFTPFAVYLLYTHLNSLAYVIDLNYAVKN